mgnify:CR=1 FL=1
MGLEKREAKAAPKFQLQAPGQTSLEHGDVGIPLYFAVLGILEGLERLKYIQNCATSVTIAFVGSSISLRALRQMVARSSVVTCPRGVRGVTDPRL